jgi:DNA-binding MarR family transcriptional regulator
MSVPLQEIVGGRVAATVLLHLHHHGEVHASGVAADSGYALSAVQKQLARLERAGLLVSRTAGRTRLYLLNRKSVFARPLDELVRVASATLSLREKEALFRTRRRPRRPGKPVLRRP